MKNHQYYVTVDDFGLKFVKCNNFTDSTQKEDKTEYRLTTLNKLGLVFVDSMRLRHEKTDIPVVVAIFEEKNK